MPLVSNTHEPHREEIINTMTKPPILLHHNMVIARLTERVKGFISTFYGGM
ncbi:transcriptional regulator [Vibrio cyclitrophicus FF160]|nr:transcriptional regulator [Vibrio cyclitrophicus FF160]PMJ19689.1 transcriptional regulator [Vibrio cyclitrophicus]